MVDPDSHVKGKSTWLIPASMRTVAHHMMAPPQPGPWAITGMAKAMPKGGTYLITYLNYGLILANPLIRDVFSGDNRGKNG
jgi:H+/gluconate symporter-like permease